MAARELKTKPDYINLDMDMSLDEATALVNKGINNAKRMNKIADGLIDAFDDKEVPYISCPNADKAPTYNDYTHLARMKEWE